MLILITCLKVTIKTIRKILDIKICKDEQFSKILLDIVTKTKFENNSLKEHLGNHYVTLLLSPHWPELVTRSFASYFTDEFQKINF